MGLFSNEWAKYAVICGVITAVTSVGCRRQTTQEYEKQTDKLFTLLPASHTGINFENRLTESAATNVFTYRNFYNGGGTGLGDLNGDDLPDIYVTSNQASNRLFINRGDFHFDDVSEVAGVEGTHAWSTGVTLADINGDGLLDIYVCNAGNVEGDSRANELFINKGTADGGIPQFSEQAAVLGIADSSLSVHAAFFDYDRDGDLDLYLVNNSFRPITSFGLRNIRYLRHPYGGDKLFRNDDGYFVDVSDDAGMFGSEIAFGLGVTIGDVDKDGWQDIFVANDFFEHDYLYINNRDGTFREELKQYMRTITLSSMGADLADFNNDGYLDLYVTDMLPEGEYRLKTTTTFESWNLYWAKLRNGYYHQFTRNTLQLNNKNGTFSEIGEFAGVAKTDWSWGALFADFDLDGNKDIFVANGIYRDVIDQDYLAYLTEEQTDMRLIRGEEVDFLELSSHAPSVRIANYAFANNGDLTFTNKTAEWGLDTPSFSNGAACGDLDNDGDLDLVVNNVNHPLFVYRNEATTQLNNNYLQVVFHGEGRNPAGIGANVTVQDDTDLYYFEQKPTRGFQSSSDHVMTIGLGRLDTLDTVTIRWPDGRKEVKKNVATNQRIVIRQDDAIASVPEHGRITGSPRPLFMEVSSSLGLEYRHTENGFVDFEEEGLLPKMLSTEGPTIAVADINGDDLDDVFIGGAKGSAGGLFEQRNDGTFVRTNVALFESDQLSEDIGTAFFDADGDGDQDLYVVSGGNEYADMAPELADRLYLNDGDGHFEKTHGHLPSTYISGSCVRPGDYDLDGDLDLFVCGRLVPRRYGIDPQSLLLRNDGRANFSNVTRIAAPGLIDIGLATDAVWTDYDGDLDPDLIVVGEWMPVTVFINQGDGSLSKQVAEGLENSHGWWNRIVADDIDEDGDPDYILGNLGLNSRIRASAEKPATMHVHDFDANGFIEQIISFENGGGSFPIVLKADMDRQLPFMRQRFRTYASYAGRSITDLFSESELEGAVVKYAYRLASVIVENRGDGIFLVRELPSEAQMSPVYGILSEDFDGDGYKDLLTAGNFFGFRPEVGRLAASYGLFLRGDGMNDFTPVPALDSGFSVIGQVRDLKALETAHGDELILVARNDAALLVYRIE